MFVSAYEPSETELNRHIAQHGDGVKDVAFAVEDLDIIVQVSLPFITEKYSCNNNLCGIKL